MTQDAQIAIGFIGGYAFGTALGFWVVWKIEKRWFSN